MEIKIAKKYAAAPVRAEKLRKGKIEKIEKSEKSEKSEKEITVRSKIYLLDIINPL
ncbi:hypothetical protein [Flavobacterium sp.]|uniref:hypothetical protein n=1 Tax=Flavobacterium sp. TaxID=239 RepID=UPI002605D996|nr:hypothetical protein [Flavobacterium sp.]